MIDSLFRIGILLSVSAFVFGCQPPSDPPSNPLIVRPGDLARNYHEQPNQALQAYSGYEVIVPLEVYKTDAHQIYWYAGDQIYPPVIVFVFAQEVTKVNGLIWIRGKCLGKTGDNITRDTPIRITITITGCELVQPSKSPAPPP